ncbi:MAG: CesT family type III secretion system chaperone [Myxococcales bacterium]|jgi:hypothetical protein
MGTLREPPRKRSEAELATYGMVDEYLARFGEAVEAQFDALDRDGYTDLRYGQLVIGVNVVPSRGVLLLLVRMGELPATDCSELLHTLLELNFLATGECAFAIDEAKEAVYLRAMRRLEGLDYAEFEGLLQTVATVAEDMSSRLRAAL